MDVANCLHCRSHFFSWINGACTTCDRCQLFHVRSDWQNISFTVSDAVSSKIFQIKPKSIKSNAENSFLLQIAIECADAIGLYDCICYSVCSHIFHSCWHYFGCVSFNWIVLDNRSIRWGHFEWIANITRWRRIMFEWTWMDRVSHPYRSASFGCETVE